MIKMRCALELQATAAIRAAEIAAENEERKRQARKALQAKTVQFCEALGKTLEERANNGNVPTVSFYFDGYDRVLEQTTKDYADHRTSYRSTDLRIDLEYLAEWFHQYCFKVSAVKRSGWRYNWGQTDIQLVTIAPAAQCLK